MSEKKTDRMDRMMKMLMEQSGIAIREFAQALGVSEITIRRDLRALEQRGSIKLINGVAIYRALSGAEAALPEYNLDYERTVFQEKKSRIGRLCASLVEASDVIAVDAGSTIEYLTRSLPRDVHLTVLAHDLNTLTLLSDHPGYDIICAGGYLYPNTRMFYSPEGISLINRTCINKAFLSAAGISGKLNVTCVAPHEMDAKRALMESSQTKILALDSSKFSKICPTTFARLSDFDAIVTDNDLSDDWRAAISDLGIRLYLA